MARESFLRGAFILALASGLSRIVGIAYMVLLPRIIHDEGMGLLQLVKPIYYFAAVMAISGMPVAVSKLVAEKAAKGSLTGVMRVFRLAMAIMVVTGSIAALFMLFSARFFTDTIAKDPGVYNVIIVLAPAAFLLAISGGLRGFFQGMQYMTPTAVAQITDQVVRVGGTIAFALLLMPRGIEYAVAGAALGSVVGEAAGVLLLWVFYFWQKNSLLQAVARRNTEDKERLFSLLKRMLALSFPVVIATILWPIMQMLDTLLIPTRMQAAGFGPQEIRDGTGYLGMALTISQFPNIVTVALATSLVPAISEAFTLKSHRLIRHRSQEAIRITIIFGFPAFAGLCLLAKPISILLFNYPQVGPALQILAVGTLTLGLIQATSGVLQGLGLVMIPVRNLAVGVLVKLVLNYYLINAQLGVLGAAWGSTAGWVVAAILNLWALGRVIGYTFSITGFVFKPLIATGVMGIAVFYVYDITSWLANSLLGFGFTNLIGVVFGTGIGFLLYFLLLMIMGVITYKDVELIPRIGKRLASYLWEWGFVQKA